MSLRLRFALWLAGIAALAFGTAIAAALVSTGRELRSQVDQSLTQRAAAARTLPALAEPGALPGPRFRPPVNLRGLAALDLLAQVIDRNGRILFSFEGSPALPVEPVDLDVARSGGQPVLRDVTIDGTPYRMITSPLPFGAVQLARDLTETQRVLAGLTLRLAIIGLAGVAASALAGWMIARRTVEPVERLTAAAERVATTQDLDQPIDVGGDDEVGRLGRSFNTMLTALSRSREQQRRLVSDAGHELRTPLTTLRTNLEVLRRRPDLDDDQRRELVDGALAEVEELTALVGELVDLAADATRSAEEPVTATLGELVAPAIERARRRTGRQIVVAGTGSTVTARPSQLDRAVGNLLDNADKWSPDGAAIEVRLDGTTLTVRDHGPGIPEEDLPHVFERFYRAAAARTRPGSGLGLAIVRQAVEANGGTVFARNDPDGGAVVGLTLPESGMENPESRTRM